MKILIIIPLLMILSCVNSSSKPESFSKINESLYFGGSPEPEDFNFLKSRGIRSIICVDGASPNLAAAKNAGLAYRHIPITYGKISLDQQKQLAKAYSELEKPVYVHCHHGKHRGPAATAVVLKNHFDWKNDKLVHLMEKAGTSKNYKGLYKSVSESEALPHESWQNITVPESAEVEALAHTMANLDRIWIKLARQLKKPLSTEERLSAGRNALLLKEYFVELKREPNSKFDEEYEEIIKKIKLLEDSLSSGHNTIRAFESVKNDCRSCHSDYRN